MLQAVAEQAQHALRATDLLARVSGKEFAVLLPDASIFAAQAACERLRRREEALRVDVGASGATGVTVSIGLVPIATGLPGSTMYEAADRALYAAKNAGRNRLKVAA